MKRKSGWLLFIFVSLIVPVLLITKGHAERITSNEATHTKQGSPVKEAKLNAALLSLAAPMQSVPFDDGQLPAAVADSDLGVTKSAVPVVDPDGAGPLSPVALPGAGSPAGSVVAGGYIRYDAPFGNSGLQNAVNVMLTDQIPGEAAFVGAIATGGVFVPATQPPAVPFTFTIPAVDTVAPIGPNINVTCTVSGAVGSQLIYCRPQGNGGVGFADGTLPAGYNGTLTFFVRVNASVNGGTLVGNSANIASGLCPNSAPPTFPPVACDSTSDSNPGNNTSPATQTLVVALSDLGITKVTSNPTPTAGGAAFAYTLTVTNNGPSNAVDVVVTDPLPPGIFLANNNISVVPGPAGSSAFSCTGPAVGQNGTVTCTSSSMAVGATATFTLVVQANRDLPGGIRTNTATVTSRTSDPGPTPNSGSVQVTIINDASLSIQKTAPATTCAGDNLTYNIAVTNSGNSSAVNVVVTDTLPLPASPAPGFTPFVSVTGTGAFDGNCSYNAGTNTLTCTAGFLPTGTSNINLVVRTSPSTANGALTNTALLAAAVGVITGTNPATATTTISHCSDLEITKDDSPDAVLAGQDINYTITVKNIGPSDLATGQFVVNDTTFPPVGTTLKGTVLAPGFSCNGTVSAATCTSTSPLPAGASATIKFTVTVIANFNNGQPGGCITNNATVAVISTPANPVVDANGTNNSSTICTPVGPGGVAITFSAPTYNVNENTPLATITVTRAGITSGTVTVNYATSNGTATAALDYGNTSGTLTFGPGVTSQTFDVPILDDTISEGTESVNLSLSGPTGGATLGSQNTAVLLILDNEPPLPNSITVYAVTVNNNLLTFNSTAPNVILSNVPITGLQPGELLVGIDFRPANGQLYALGNSNRLYTVNTTTGAATAVAAPFSPGLTGIDFGSDFNPMVDRLRVVSDADQNFRLNPNTGAVAGSDTALAYASGDPNFGSNPNVVGSAYTNSFAGASSLTTTTLYGIDSNLDTLVRQGGVDGAAPSPNSGQLTTIGPLGVNPTGLVGFDIQGSNNKAFAALNAPAESSKLYTLNLATGAATLLGAIGGSELIRDISVAAGTFQFSATSSTISEGAGKVTLTVTRTGNTSIPAAVNFSTSDGSAIQKSDYTIALGTVQFAAGETSKSFDVFIVDDGFTEPTENFTVTLSAPTNDFSVSGNSSTTVNITDNDAVPPATNPIDDTAFFVRQHYLDFLNREPDASGFAFWTNEINSCGANATCISTKRQNVSAAFFLSIEFQETGGNIIRTQRAAFGRQSNNASLRVPYLQFMRDARQVGNGVIVGQSGFQTVLEANKQAYAEQIVNSPAFIIAYPTSQTAAQFVDALFASAAVTPGATERNAAITAFGAGGTPGRSAALRSVTDSDSVRQAELNPSFVLMQYFGYLRRNPTDAPDANDNGYQFWLTKLNSFNGNFVQADMVRAFIISGEYRGRFGTP